MPGKHSTPHNVHTHRNALSFRLYVNILRVYFPVDKNYLTIQFPVVMLIGKIPWQSYSCILPEKILTVNPMSLPSSDIS